MSVNNLDILSERVSFISEYNYYVPNLSEEGEEDTELDGSEEVDPNADLEDAEDAEIDPNAEESGDDASLADLEGEETEEISSDGSGEVEIDVTDIVTRQDEMGQSIEDITQKIESALQNITKTVSDLKSDMFNNANTVNSKIDKVEGNLSKEMQKRNPTPEEQLQLRSLSAYPYNMKLTDYWEPTFNYADALKNPNEKPTSKLDASSGEKPKDEEEDEEYVLRVKDVYDVNDFDIKKTF